MDNLLDILEGTDGQVLEYSLSAMGLSLLLAFVLGQAIAWVYLRTHRGLSYSRTFTQSLVLLTMVVALVMFVIGNSIVTAFGLIGALAIIRFRNVLKDTRDTVFVFFSLVLGMALGSQRYLAAIVGAVALLLVTSYLQASGFGARSRFDGHLSFVLRDPSAEDYPDRPVLNEVLHRFCRKWRRMSERRQDAVRELVLQIRLRDRRRGDELVRDLRALAGVEHVSLVLPDELSEV